MSSTIRGSDNFDTAQPLPQRFATGRALNSTYTSGDRPRLIMVAAAGGTGSDSYIEAQVSLPSVGFTGMTIARTNEVDSTGNWRPLTASLTFFVPPNTQYRVLTSGGAPSLILWSEAELR